MQNDGALCPTTADSSIETDRGDDDSVAFLGDFDLLPELQTNGLAEQNWELERCQSGISASTSQAQWELAATHLGAAIAPDSAVPADSTRSANFATRSQGSDIEELREVNLLPDFVKNVAKELDCPYCESATRIGGNRSHSSRKANTVSAWYVVRLRATGIHIDLAISA